ncbi:MAG: hypothetical protein AAGF23_24155 [Acidobacteriota bacterium]
MTVKNRHRAVCIGVEISSSQRPGAICVTEIQDRGGFAAHQRHWAVRFLEKLPAGTRLPDIIKRLTEIVGNCVKHHDSAPQVLVNSTGIGTPVIDHLESLIEDAWFHTVYFNQGDRRVEEDDDTVILGKAYLVSALQTALQTERLHLPRKDEFDRLAEDLLKFEIEVPHDANERYGAFPVGSQDELVTALGLTVQHDPGMETAIGGSNLDHNRYIDRGIYQVRYA